MSEPEPAEKKPGKFSKLKSAFKKTDDGQEPFSSFDGHPYDRSSKGFSTLRSEFLFGKILKPIDNYLEKDDRGETSDVGFFGSIWQFSGDEDVKEGEEENGGWRLSIQY